MCIECPADKLLLKEENLCLNCNITCKNCNLGLVIIFNNNN